MKLLLNLCFLCSFSIIFVACSSQKPAPQLIIENTYDPTPSTSEQLGDAVAAPLNDLNIVRTAIPKVLRDARKNPYAPPAENTCAVLATDIKLLDESLGADLDTPETSKNPSLVVRGIDNIQSASVSELKKTTQSVVPFRNWIRKLSGAERNSKAVASAIAAGSIRRAYLKGVGQAIGCKSPAAPHLLATHQ